jgi:hypothetical protein
VIVHRQEMSNGNPSIRTEATTAGEIGTIAIIGIEIVIEIVNESAIGIDTKMRNTIDVLLKGTQAGIVAAVVIATITTVAMRQLSRKFPLVS